MGLLVGVHDDPTINRHLGKNYPIMNLHERVLNVLSCGHVDDVIIGAPWAVSDDMITTFNIQKVVAVSDPATGGPAAISPKSRRHTHTNEHCRPPPTADCPLLALWPTYVSLAADPTVVMVMADWLLCPRPALLLPCFCLACPADLSTMFDPRINPAPFHGGHVAAIPKGHPKEQGPGEAGSEPVQARKGEGYLQHLKRDQGRSNE